MVNFKRILLVDDEDDIREVAQVSLELMGGWNVITAASSQEGWLKAQREKPDAVLLDVMMPDMDGPTLLQKLRMDPVTQKIPVIFLTAKVRASNYHRLTDAGAIAVLAKPFGPVELANQVAAILAWS